MAKERGLDDVCYLTNNLHVWPDFHGNRSPIANPNLKGMVIIMAFFFVKNCGFNFNKTIGVKI